MGASSSGLLDEAKVTHIKGIVGKSFQDFSVFYRQQYAVSYLGHIHQEVEPKKEGRGLLLTHRPKYDPEVVLYQGSVKFSCWDEQGKKCRDRCIVVRRDFRVEIHDGTESLSRGGAPKLVLQPVGGFVFTSEEESRDYMEKSCAAILNGVKEDSSSVVPSSDEFAVYLHVPHTGHSCFLFQQEEERDHFLSALKTCIRHRNLDPWHDSSHESQAYAQALRLYQQDRGCYESWETLLGTEEQVFASQVMKEVLPWLQNQLQTKVKGKKTERIRQWLATVQATYTLVLEQLTAALEAQREECRQTAAASQALIRSDLDQIMSSHNFLEQKVRAHICKEAEEVCSESVVPYMSSILEVLTEHIGAGILGMQHTLKTQMNSAFSLTNGGTENTQKVLSGLHSVSLDQNYRQVENLAEKLEDLKQRFGLSSTQRLVHSAQLEMEQLLDSAVYTLEQFLQSSTKLQPSQVAFKMEKAKERVLKQLDHDSRVVQRRLYLEALLQITLPSFIKRMDCRWRTELQQFEQYIFSDYSSFILVQNIYDGVLRNILSKEIETVVQDAASEKSNNLLLDTSDLAISQYSLLAHTPPLSAPDSPAAQPRPSSSSGVPSDDQDTAPVVDEECKTPGSPQNDTKPQDETISEPSSVLLSPVIIVTQQFENPETSKEEKVGGDDQSAAAESEGAATRQVNTTDSQPDSGSTTVDAPDPGSTTVDAPDPGSTTVDGPDPGSTTVDGPDPGSTTVDGPDPGSTTVDAPDPGSTTIDAPDPGSTTIDAPDPGSPTQDSPDPGSTTQDSSDPGSTTIDAPDPGSTTQDAPDPESTTVDAPDPGSTTQDAPDPESTTVDAPDAGATTQDAPDPESTTQDSPDPGSTTVDAPDPGATTVDALDAGSTTVDAPDPGSTTVDALDAGSTTVDAPDAGSTTVDAPDAGSTTVDAPDAGSTTVDALDAGSTTVDALDAGSTSQNSPDPGSTTQDSPDPESITPGTPDPGPVVSVSPFVEAKCSESVDSTSENSIKPDLSTSDPVSKNPPPPSGSPETDGPVKISLRSLSEAISPCSMDPAGVQVQQNTDRAIYLTGQIKENWARAKEGQQEEAAEKEETTESREEDEGPAESCTSCATPGESTVISTSEPRGSEDGLGDGTGAEKQKDDEVEAADDGDHTEDQKEKDPGNEEVLQSPEPAESELESAEEIPLDSVAIIRELVTEIHEVETIITPHTNSSPP